MDRKLALEAELRAIQQSLIWNGLDLHDWVSLHDKKIRLIEELMNLQQGKENDNV